jgi:hypothetical protein
MPSCKTNFPSQKIYRKLLSNKRISMDITCTSSKYNLSSFSRLNINTSIHLIILYLPPASEFMINWLQFIIVNFSYYNFSFRFEISFALQTEFLFYFSWIQIREKGINRVFSFIFHSFL